MTHDPNAQLAAEHEALIQFVYQAPVGLMQTGIDGDIQMINPMSVQLLMPLARDGDLANLFDVLQDVAPALRQRAGTFRHARGMLCEGLRIQLPPVGTPARRTPRVLSLTLLKLDSARLMAVLLDVTDDAAGDQDASR